MTILSTVALVLAVMLAGTFGWAAQAKFRNQRATSKGFSALGLPQAKALAVAVPIVELLIAIGLLTFSFVGALAAAALLVAFTLVLGQAERSADGEIRCGCFGAADSEPVTWVTFVRNAGLFLAALFIVVVRPPSALNLTSSTSLAIVASAVVAALIGSVFLALLSVKRQMGVVFSQHPKQVTDHSS